jgi:hypothetical protein
MRYLRSTMAAHSDQAALDIPLRMRKWLEIFVPGSGKMKFATSYLPRSGCSSGRIGAGAVLGIKHARQGLVFHLNQIESLLGDLSLMAATPATGSPT